MRELMTELIELRLHGVASAWEQLVLLKEKTQRRRRKGPLDHLLQQEQAELYAPLTIR